MTAQAFRKLALSMREAHEKPHFDPASFRVGKKIFATMVPDGSEAMVRIRPLKRVYELLSEHPDAFFDYGGWTWRNGTLGIRLQKVDAKLLRSSSSKPGALSHRSGRWQPNAPSSAAVVPAGLHGRRRSSRHEAHVRVAVNSVGK